MQESQVTEFMIFNLFYDEFELMSPEGTTNYQFRKKKPRKNNLFVIKRDIYLTGGQLDI